jgi:hypothetical protein
MKAPKLTLIFTAIIAIAFAVQDAFLTGRGGWLEFGQDWAFIILGGVLGGVGFGLNDKNKKPELINTEKLALEVAQDEKKQLQEKVKTLEAALERIMK